MRKVLYQIILAFIILGISSSCGYKHYLTSGKEDYNNLKFASAKDKFNTALQKKPESYESLKMLALTLTQMKDYKGAQQAYKLAMNYPQVTGADKFNYGRLLMSNDKHDQAEVVFQQYLEGYPDDQLAITLLQSCQFIELFKDDTSKYKIEPLPLLNNESMYSPVLYDGGLAYTAERSEKGAKNPWTGNAYNDIYHMKFVNGVWVDQEPISSIFNQKFNDGPITFNKAEDFTVFTRSHSNKDGRKRQKNEENVNNLFLYSAEKIDGEWGNVTSLPFNSEDYSTMHPSLNAGGDTLYFSSNMEGGQGGYDIYMSSLVSGSWTTPKNLGSTINTTENEVFPTISSDRTLYFSSDGHPTLGALDIYRTQLQDGEWKRPRNMNYPVNSAGDDFSLIMTNADTIGYFTSNHQGVDKIFELKRKPFGTVYIDGLVLGPDSMPLEGAAVKLLDGRTGEVIKEVKTSTDGKFDFELLSDRLYKIESSKAGFFTESYERSTLSQFNDEDERLVFNMKKLVVTDPNSDFALDGEGVYKVENIYYDFNKFNIRADAAKQLDKLVKLMNDNPSISIELHSHTDSQGNDSYNMELSEKRAKSAKAYLVQKGIDIGRIGSKGFGESRIINRCKNDVECSDEEHEENRRTEFIVTKA
ncbi:MAG: OmpA family protein [Flavobacteriales bacterium]|nr:OmpA family protein [Flavobacteriales bacterium]